MKYCVVKGTTIVIDGSENPINIMLENAGNSGYTENDVEVLNEEEYQARKDLEPKAIEMPSVEERLAFAEDTINFLLGL